MRNKLTDTQKLVMDICNGNVQCNFSTADGEQVIRQRILDAVGGEWNYYSFHKNQWDVFEIIREVLTPATGVLVEDSFSEFVEVHDTELGDKPAFDVEDNSLFRVATISTGTNDIRRQKLYGKTLQVPTENIGLKVYEDFDRFMSGRCNLPKMIERVKLSFSHELAIRVYNAIYDAFDSLSAPYQATGTFKSDQLTDLIGHVEAQTGQVAKVYGTKKALGKITSATPSDKMKDELNLLGHFGMFQGTELVELPQGHKAGTSNFAVSDDVLFVIPNDNKIVKLVLEGDPIVKELADGTERNDQQVEFLFQRKAGIAVLKSNIYGIYKLS